MNTNLNVIKKNQSLLPIEYILVNDLANKKYRGLSSFASKLTSNLGQIQDYIPKTDKNGVFVGDNQDFWFTSILGSNSFYDLTDLQDNHNSNKTFIEILTHESI